MTFSILARDEKTGVLAGACATGSLCVGGWVLRGQLGAGMVASQGTAPSTLWRDEALQRMGSGDTAENTLNSVCLPDDGRAHRQLAVLDRSGGTSAFTGDASVAWAGHRCMPNLVVAGNMLADAAVLEALADTFLSVTGSLADRLMSALRTADRAGGDSRGLKSAAMLVVSPNAPPLDIRVDYADAPLVALSELMLRTRAHPYAGWLDEVPVQTDPYRSPEAPPKQDTATQR